MAPVYKFSNAGGFTSKQRYTSMLAGNAVWNPWEPQGAYDALSTITVPSGGVASIEFAGLPNTYKHLQIRYLARDNAAGGNNNIFLTFNGDTSSNYNWHYLTGDGSTAFAGANSSTSILVGKEASATAGTSIFGVGIIDILDYANTNKNKTLRALTGNDNNGSGSVFYASGLWRSTSAITSLTLSSGNTQQQNSQFTLYGVR